MRGGGLGGRSVAMIAATLLTLGAAPSQEQVEADVLVTARRLRAVGITFYAMGAHLRRCDVTRTSGTALIDRTMCALVRTCLAEGERGRDRVMACVNGRIDALAAGTASLPVETDPSLPTGPLASSSSPEASDQDGGEVVVTARRRPLRPGRWHFTELSWIEATGRARRGPYLREWRRCLPAVQTEEGLTRALDGVILSAGQRRPSACRWRITAGNGRLAGRQRCASLSSLRTGELEGRLAGDEVELTKRLHLRRRVQVEGPMATPSLRGEPPPREIHATHELSGRREGDCG